MKIIAAVIGSGIGIKHVEAIKDYRNSKIKYICEKNIKKHDYLRKKFPKVSIIKNDEIIFKDKSINLVSIASYDNYHFKQIMKGIKSKKNLIVEKPMCLEYSELKKIEKMMKKNKDLYICSNLVLRVNSLFEKLKKKINKDQIYYLEADYIWGRLEKFFSWRSKIKNYDFMLGAGVHMVDLIMWLLNDKPKTVYCESNKILTKKTIFNKKSFAVCLMKFSNDIVAKISANPSNNYNHFHEIKLFGKKNTFLHTIQGTNELKTKKKRLINKKILNNYPDKQNRKKLIKNFIDFLINKKTKRIISFNEQINLMKVCFAIIKSQKLKKAVKVIY